MTSAIIAGSVPAPLRSAAPNPRTAGRERARSMRPSRLRVSTAAADLWSERIRSR